MGQQVVGQLWGSCGAGGGSLGELWGNWAMGQPGWEIYGAVRCGAGGS